MRIAWDCRAVAEHMGGIGQATVGWLRDFLRHKPTNWEVVCIFSAINSPEYLDRLFPGIARKTELHLVEAGMVAPQFEQLHLPGFLQAERVDCYFNTSFTLPAVKTTRFQASVIHDIVFLDHPDWVEPNLRQYLLHGADLSLRRADVPLTVSAFSRDRIRAVAPERGWQQADALQIIQPGLPSKEFQKKRAISSQLPPELNSPQGYLLYLGSIEEKKGIQVLLDAYAQLLHERREQVPQLVLAGGQGGKAFDLQAALKARNIQRQTRVMGYVPEDLKRSLIENAQVFLFPSQYEGFGIPPLEAMALKTPVIAAQSSSLPEVLGDAALFADPHSPGEWTEAIKKVIDTSRLRSDLVKKGAARVKYFADKSVGAALVNIFRQLEEVA